MSLNTSALAKTVAVIGVVWAIMLAADHVGAVGQIGLIWKGAPTILHDYGLTVTDDKEEMPKGALPGVLVTAVVPGSIADQYKLHQGDVITAVNHAGEYRTPVALAKRLGDGDVRSFLVWRDGLEMNPEKPIRAAKIIFDPRSTETGIRFFNTADDERTPANAPYGLLVVEVDRRSVGEAAGVKVGNVITAVNGKKVVNGDTFYFANAVQWNAKAAPPLALTLWQDGKTSEVKIR